MVDKSNELEVVLRLQDLATRELKQFVGQTKKAGDTGKKSFNKLDKASVKAKASIGKMAAGAAALYGILKSGQVLVRSGFGFIEAASALEEANSKFEVLFGTAAPESSKAIDVMAKTLGRARGTLVGAAADFAGLLVPMGFADDEAAKFSLGLTQLAQDLESFNNVPFEKALQAIRSGIVGNAESLLRFGVDIRLTEVKLKALELGIGSANGELTAQETILVRLAIINEKTARAQGDVVRTSHQYANSMRALKEGVKSARTELGEFLIPIIEDAVAELGGAKAIVNDVKVAFTVAAFATAGFVRAGVALITASRGIIEDMGGVNTVLKFVGTAVALAVQSFDTFIATLRFLGDSAVTNFKALGDAAQTSLSGLLIILNETNAAIKALASFAGFDLDIGTDFGAGIIDNAKPLAQIFEEIGASSVENFTKYSNRVEKAVADNATFTRSLDKIRTSVTSIINDSDLEGIVPDFAALSGQLDAALNAPLSRAAAAATDSGTSAGAAAKEWNVFAFAMKQGAVAAVAGSLELQRLSSVSAGAEAATAQYGATLSNFALGQDLANGIFGSLENGIQSFSQSLVEGEADFGAFAKNILKEVAAMIIQFLILKALRGALGFDAAGGATGGGLASILPFEKGGIMPGNMLGSMPINAYASGGVANTPQLAVFGEGRGAEAYVPLPDGKSIPVKQEGGGGGPVNVTFQIQAIDTQTGAEFLARNADMIATNVANSIESGSNRKLVKATRGS
tara:strand:+ start:39848 stop:42073 length:2226 start_codon:yes stop_codon:yes gene_type:complete